MKNFCTFPFKTLMTFNSGSVKPCCDSTSMVTNPKESLLSTWNSQVWKDLRKSILRDERSEACRICWDKEDNGYVSARDNDREEWSIMDHCAPNGQMLSKPQNISLRLGNNCNLACVMCGPVNSTRWYRDKDIFSRHFGKNSDVSEEDIFLDPSMLNDFLSDVVSINFIGGEPLLYREHQEIVMALIENGRAKDVSLEYFTNTTQLPDWCESAWAKFKKIDLRSSIDATGAAYNYIRYPGDWSVVEKNIYKLNSWKLENMEYAICFVLMNINIFELEKLYLWRNKIDWKIKTPIIRPDYIVDPFFLAPHYMLAAEKKLAIESLQRAQDIAIEGESHLILDMIDQIRAEPKDMGLAMESLGRYLQDLDKRRNLNHQQQLSWTP